MFQRLSAPASPLFERLSTGAGRRISGLVLVILIEALLVLLVLTLGHVILPDPETTRRTTLVNIRAEEIPAAAPEARQEEQQQQRTETRRENQPPTPQPPQPAQPSQSATPPAPPTPPAPTGIIRTEWSLSSPNPMRLPNQPTQPVRPAYGPQDVRSAAMRDTPRVGTAPNGQPLYAAEWYREPAADMMRAYLSGARGPGWGLIACRTAPDFRVEDCVALDEYPNGSNITRSALAAAWEFRVRPPRRGGMPLVGSWVRIRIDYH